MKLITLTFLSRKNCSDWYLYRSIWSSNRKDRYYQRLRCVEADLQRLCEGKYKGTGRPGRFNGKINFEDLARFDHTGILNDQITVYTKILKH